MRRLTLLLLLPFLGCGLLNETEQRPAQLKAEAGAASCEFPGKNDLFDEERATLGAIHQAIDCLEKKMQSAFDQLKGEVPDELSAGELRTLYERKILDLPEAVGDFWKDIEAALPALHPEARPAISRGRLQEIIAWARRYAPLYFRALRAQRGDPDLDWMREEETLGALEAALGFISPKFRFTYSQASGVMERTCKRVRSCKWHEMRDELEAGWIAKSLVLEDKDRQGIRADVRGDTLIEIGRVGIESLRRAKLTFRWGNHEVMPQYTPEGLAEEWVSIAALWKNYFAQRYFAYIESDPLSWVLKKTHRRSRLSELAGDIVRASQRLSPAGERQPGLHPVGLVPLLDTTAQIALDIYASRLAFGSCSPNTRCAIPLRKALAHPVLKEVALKGGIEHWRYEEVTPEKRLDYEISWATALSRLTERKFVGQLFDAFDSNKDGKIPLEGVTTEDLNETFDLAFTFLRFLSVEGSPSPPKTDDSVPEEQLPTLILVKPGPLYRILGLIGDRWMTDGNGDRALDSDEFFSVMKVYSDISDTASSVGYRTGADRFARAADFKPQQFDWSNSIYGRKSFVQGLHRASAQLFPTMRETVKALPAEPRDSLFHALVGVPVRNPIEVYSLMVPPDSAQLSILNNYTDDSAGLAPAALISVLDRLMHRCDYDESNYFEWNELDCAVPLILDAGLQTVNSALLDIDPGPNDAARVLLSFLQMKGIPLTLAKLVVTNGSVLKFQMEPEMKKLAEWIHTDLKADWTKLAYFIGAPKPGTVGAAEQLKYWKLEAIRRFGKCDTAPKNEELQGEAELECFAQEVLRQVADSLQQLVGSGATPDAAAYFGELEASRVIRLGLALATQTAKEIEGQMLTLKAGSEPKKILLILEEIIRRSVPLWQMPD